MSKKQQYNVAYRKVVAPGQEFTPTIGRAFEGSKGHIKIRLDSMPLAQYWKDGELLLFPMPDEEETDGR